MWRALFLAIGISLCFLGAETLVVDRAILASPADDDRATSELYDDYAPSTPRRAIVPPDWAPWSLLSAGVVVTLYAMTFHRGGE